ncbi:hypothetical protein RO3G_14896 [Rhizopus delemar RA 99-880]|uniref:Uncharacterized protein n=3 Tax=Rhizopus TaxID=4842 RepID=I1CP05_RHIO9|nr:hypothetical protein RO3G_14896 [Rhizopus delemar RA 99-880]|eukprot:EIE90185.1 hypothetical protein RO3G_14896 [Rhizopus delemar RA 99-880]
MRSIDVQTLDGRLQWTPTVRFAKERGQPGKDDEEQDRHLVIPSWRGSNRSKWISANAADERDRVLQERNVECSQGAASAVTVYGTPS